MLGLSITNSRKQKSTSFLIPPKLNLAEHNPQCSIFNAKLDKEQYTPSPFPNDEFAINNESDNRDNNAVAMMKGLFMNIGHRSSYKRFTNKALQETCEFFILSKAYNFQELGSFLRH